MSDHDDVMQNEELLQVAEVKMPAAWQKALWVGAESCLAILMLQLIGQKLQQPLLLAPFGASCVLLFVAPQSEFAQPRNILLSYAIATLVGFVALWLFAGQWWTVAVAVGATIALMCLTHTVHPPAGAHPIVIVMGAPSLSILLPTLAAGLLLLLLAAWALHRFARREQVWPAGR